MGEESYVGIVFAFKKICCDLKGNAGSLLAFV